MKPTLAVRRLIDARNARDNARDELEQAEALVRQAMHVARHLAKPPLTYREIGVHLGISEQAASQLYKRNTRLF